MNEAISAAIRDNLPAATASELSKYLTQAEADKATLVKVKADVTDQFQKIVALQSKLDDQSKLDERERVLAESQKTLRNEQLQLAMDRAKLEAAVANASNAATQNIVAMFLKLPQVRTNVFSEVGVPVEGMAPGNGYSGSMGAVIRSNESHTTIQAQE